MSASLSNGPWSWKNYTDAGVNFGVAPLPSIDGNPAKPFIGVGAFAINAASPNKDLAKEFLENYVLTEEGITAWNANGGLGATANIAAGKAASANIQATLANAAVGIPMPSNPEMGAFWSSMGPALGNITSGAQDVKTGTRRRCQSASSGSDLSDRRGKNPPVSFAIGGRGICPNWRSRLWLSS